MVTTKMKTQMKTQILRNAVGAEVSGVDLSAPLSAAIGDALRGIL